MKIQIKDDGRNKFQSVEASVIGDRIEPLRQLDFYAIGYGCTLEEAIANLKLSVEEIKKRLESIDYGS